MAKYFIERQTGLVFVSFRQKEAAVLIDLSISMGVFLLFCLDTKK